MRRTKKNEEKIDIVLLTYNRRKVLQRTLEAIWARTKTPYRLIVLDNGSNDGTVKYLKGLLRDKRIAKLVELKDLPLCFAYNEGYKHIESEYCVTTQDDIIPPLLKPDWLFQIKDLLDRNPDHGAIAMRVGRMINTRFKRDREIGYAKRACCAYMRIHKKSTLAKNDPPFGERYGHTDDVEFKKLMQRIGLQAGFASNIWANHVTHSQVDNKGYGDQINYRGYNKHRNASIGHKPYPNVDPLTNQPI